MSRVARADGADLSARTDRRAPARVVALALAASLMFLQFGCALLPGLSSERVPPEQQAAYSTAMGNLPGDTAAARIALDDFLTRYPRSALADDALEELARLALAEGRSEDGVRFLARILNEHAQGDRAPSARLRLAEIEYSRDGRVEARRLLSLLDLEDLSRPQQQSALRLRIALAQTPVTRMRHLGALRAILEDEVQEGGQSAAALERLELQVASVTHEIDALVGSAASAELEAMMRDLRGRPPAASIALELSRRAIESGQFDLATRRLDRTAGLVRSDAERDRLAALRARLAARRDTAAADAALPPLRSLSDRPRPRVEGARGTLGVVLPLSGEFEDFGQEALRGILLATQIFDAETDRTDAAALPAVSAGDSELRFAPTGNRPEIRLLVRDSQGDPARAAAAIRELAADPNVAAVVGPIFSDESVAAAEAAEATGLPLVALSSREAVSEHKPHVFRTRTTPGDEVDVLVDHAFDTLGARRFAVLYPETRYGRGMRKLYWDAVRARGGDMVAASSYDPEATDFAEPIRDMIGYRFLTHWERKGLAEREEILRAIRVLEPEDAALVRDAAYSILGPELVPLPPIVDFDVLFIPDAAESIALIAPALAFHEVRGVRLLGSNDWVDEDLLRVAGRHVSGSVIVTAFHLDSDVPIVREFVEGFRNTFSRIPDMYAAQAFDATNLVLVQLAAGRRDREGVREGLLDTRAYPGATGTLTMRPDGNARRRPFLLGVSGGRFRSLD